MMKWYERLAYIIVHLMFIAMVITQAVVLTPWYLLVFGIYFLPELL